MALDSTPSLRKVVDVLLRREVAPVVALALLCVMFVALRGRNRMTKALQDSSEKISLRLAKKENVSHNVRKFTFALPAKNIPLGLPVGKHIAVSAEMANPRTGGDKQYVARHYTPVSDDTLLGSVELVVKIYGQNEHPRFPDGGWMSQYLDSMKIGQAIDFRGPIGKIQYTGDGKFVVSRKEKQYKHIGMVAGGTGVSPMFQLIKAALQEDSQVKLSLLCANQSPDDVLLGAELEDFQTLSKGRFQVHHTVDRPTPEWKGYSGFVTDTMLASSMPPPTMDTVILCCGPPIMLEKCVLPLLEKLGYKNVLTY